MNLNFLLAPVKDVKNKESSFGDSYLGLDGLRGIAVLVVLMSHTSAFGMRGQGSLGVLLFFFLSGFVLSLPFVDKPKRIRNGLALGRYFTNRFLRIVPAYWVTCLVIYYWMSAPLDWLLWNISFIKGWNHFWSVAEEVRFYLLFPLVMIALSFIKWPVARVVLVCGLIFVSYKFKEYHQIDMMVGKSVSFYFWMFLGGMLAALIHKFPRWQLLIEKRGCSALFSLLGILVLASLVFTSNYAIEFLWSNLFSFIPSGFRFNGWSHPEFWFAAFLVLFLAAASIKGRLLNSILTLWILRHIGLLSYSIYIIHMTIRFKIAQYGVTTQELFVLVFLSSYCFAYVSYILIEKPFLRFKKSKLLWFNRANASI